MAEARQGARSSNIASMSGVIVNRGLMQVHYNASKAGVIHNVEVDGDGMGGSGRAGVNTISPGLHRHADEHAPRNGSSDERSSKARHRCRGMASVDEDGGPGHFPSPPKRPLSALVSTFSSTVAFVAGDWLKFQGAETSRPMLVWGK